MTIGFHPPVTGGGGGGLTVVTSADIVDGEIVAVDIADGGITNVKLATNPLARANHTGTQPSATITGLGTAAASNTGDFDAAGAAATAQAAAVQRSNHTGTQLLATISDAGTAAANDTGDFDAAGSAATAESNATAAAAADATTKANAAAAASVPTSRTITAGTGLTGGGDLSANRTLTVAYGTSGSTAAVGNDARLSDERTPTDGSVTVNKLGALAVTNAKINDVDASKITAGTVAPARLGSGSGGSSKFLREDSSFQTLPTVIAGTPFAFTAADYLDLSRFSGTGSTTASIGGSVSATTDTAFYVPFLLSAAVSVDAMAMEVQIASATGTLRLGIHNDTGSGRPGTVALDASTAAATSTGMKTLAFSSTPLAAGRYWAVAVFQGVTTTNPVYRGTQAGSHGVGETTPTAGTAAMNVYLKSTDNSVTGALASTPSLQFVRSANPAFPHIFLRFA